MLIATESELFRISGKAPDNPPALLIEDIEIKAIAEMPGGAVAALSQGRLAVWHNGSGPEACETAIEDTISAILVVSESPLVLLIGTEPPHIYRFSPGNPADKMARFEQLPCRREWSTPWGGPPAVRSLARGGMDWFYADIHVGSIMRSPDGGTTWQPVNPALHQDVHQVATCKAAPELVYANTADAVWISYNRGESWLHRPFPVKETYGRAIAVHPDDPDRLLATVSQGPHGVNVRGRLFHSADAGCTWRHATDGFPTTTQDNLNTHHIAFDSTGGAWAAVLDRLYHSDDHGVSWQPFWQAPQSITAIAVHD